MVFFSEAPLAIKEQLLEHVTERVNYYENHPDASYDFESVAQVQRTGTLFYYEHLEYITYHNIGRNKVCLNFKQLLFFYGSFKKLLDFPNNFYVPFLSLLFWFGIFFSYVSSNVCVYFDGLLLYFSSISVQIYAYLIFFTENTTVMTPSGHTHYCFVNEVIS